VGIWTETRGLILRADGAALVVTRGTTPAVLIPVALDALTADDLAVWLAGLVWQHPKGRPWLRRVRLVADGVGTWKDARVEFLAQWRRDEWGPSRATSIGGRWSRLTASQANPT